MKAHGNPSRDLRRIQDCTSQSRVADARKLEQPRMFVQILEPSEGLGGPDSSYTFTTTKIR